MTRGRTADCPGCAHPQAVAVVGTLAAHHDDGTPMPAAGADYARMCPWSYTRPDADRPAAAAFVETARGTTGGRAATHPEPGSRAGPVQLDLLDLLDLSPNQPH